MPLNVRTLKYYEDHKAINSNVIYTRSEHTYTIKSCIAHSNLKF